MRPSDVCKLSDLYSSVITEAVASPISVDKWSLLNPVTFAQYLKSIEHNPIDFLSDSHKDVILYVIDPVFETLRIDPKIASAIAENKEWYGIFHKVYDGKLSPEI